MGTCKQTILPSEYRMNVLLKLISWFAKKVFYYPLFWYGLCRSFQLGGKAEFLAYWKASAISDDVDLHVVGQYALNDTMYKSGPKAGNGLRTVSCWMGMAGLTRFGMWCKQRLSRVDKNHCDVAVQLHKEMILQEFKELHINGGS